MEAAIVYPCLVASFGQHRPVTLPKALLTGTAGFTIASLAAFGFWAFAGPGMYRTVGEGGLYAVCALLFIIVGALLLRPLTALPLSRFAFLYAAAFAGYAVCWCAAWFLIKGRAGEWTGSLTGCVAFCMIVAAVLATWRSLPKMVVILFAGNAAGYFLGSHVYYLLRHEYSLLSKLAWGLFYGLGMGAALGYVFHVAGTKSGSIKAAVTPS
jgi:hypothetical protein